MGLDLAQLLSFMFTSDFLFAPTLWGIRLLLFGRRDEKQNEYSLKEKFHYFGENIGMWKSSIDGPDFP